MWAGVSVICKKGTCSTSRTPRCWSHRIQHIQLAIHHAHCHIPCRSQQASQPRIHTPRRSVSRGCPAACLAEASSSPPPETTPVGVVRVPTHSANELDAPLLSTYVWAKGGCTPCRSPGRRRRQHRRRQTQRRGHREQSCHSLRPNCVAEPGSPKPHNPQQRGEKVCQTPSNTA